MKTLSCTAIVLVAAGSAFAAKTQTEGFRMNAVEGFSGPTGTERSGFITAFDVSGIQSWDAPGSAFNTVIFLNIGVGNAVNGLGWDVNLTAFAPSWRNELGVLVTDSSGVGGFFLTPGTDGSAGGPTNYNSGGNITKLANVGIPNVNALGDGLIRLEFFEYYDDAAGAQDGVWNSGNLFFQTVNEIPTPGAVGLLGLAGVGLLGRKRR